MPPRRLEIVREHLESAPPAKATSDPSNQIGQADLATLLAHLHHDHDQDHILRSDGPAPVVAARVRASVGRPGASAQGEYRRRATELATWARGLPWRIVALAAAGVAAWLAAARVAPDLTAPAGVTVAAGLCWLLRFRSSPDTVAWRRGAAGERRTARLLAPLERRGWAVLHDLAVPRSQANLDHLMIGPGGVFVIDSKQYRGRLQLDGSGRLWPGRYPLASPLRAVDFEADHAARVLPDPGVAVVPIAAVHGAQVPGARSWWPVCRSWRPGAGSRRSGPASLMSTSRSWN